MMTGSLKKKKKKIFFFFFFLNLKKKGGPLIRACSLIRSNTVFIFLLFSKDDRSRSLSICDTLLS